ncbi:hypothetical protein GQ43DRAFT_454699 [Delitschia confertaspora ATCC 74209]|uniref:MI domain-containing protein n=1 Tax=Delitschia confertaspora ATCC 74209 TaxID=1513339 RepID=A0A9P4JTL9_9PLEO|nr:hypothetical protein GQ43DRAFT_454699 [Delitschia confertaspora ATCC 74209]
MRQQNFKGPKLPKELRDQFGGDPSNRSKGRGGHRQGPLNRKDRRKAEREEKKTQKKWKTKPRHAQIAADEESDDEEDPFDISDDEPWPPKSAATTKDSPEKPLKSILKKDTKPEPPKRKRDAESPPPPRISRAVKEKLEEEDKEIKALEKKLGIKGNKSKSTADDDGLDGLLDGLGDSGSEDDGFGDSSGKRKRPEDEEWLASKRRKALGVQDEPSSDGELGSEDDLGLDDDMDMDMDGKDSDSLEEESEEELDEGNMDDELEDDSDFDGLDDSDDEPTQPRVRENPYAPPVAPTTTPNIAKYIPPSMRGPPSSDAEALSRLKRKVQGLLNRLSEANMLTILKDIEKIYQENPRGYVHTTLIDLLIGLLADPTTLMDTFLILHAGFITAVYKVIGTDFGAQMVERIVSEFDKHYQENKNGTGKQATNLMSLVAELYILQVIGSNLVFDYVKLFLNELSEINTELLLRIVKISGQQLRQDDPSSLKDIVLLLQKAVSTTGEKKLSVRTKFMIETINNLKNNRVKTGIDASSIVTEHTTRIKKTLGSLNTRNLKGTEPIRIGLADIRDTEKKGKWWLVGASWRNDKADNVSNQEETKTMKNRKEPMDDDETILSSQAAVDLHQLARENGMNTDIRRAIFITIMSAADFKDAHVRLMKLNLKRSQEVEIPRVIVHCAGSEQVYNPYYTLLARKVCGEHKLRKAFQFALWDIFKTLGEKDEEDNAYHGQEEDAEAVSLRKLVNLGKLYGTLMANHGLPISTLKTLNFAYLQPKTKTLVEVILVTAILQSQKSAKDREHRDEKALLSIFVKVDVAPNMIPGLQYFVRKVLKKTDITADKKEKETVNWACKLIPDTLAKVATLKLTEE